MEDIVILDIYADEVRERISPGTGDRIDYIGLLLDPSGGELLKDIREARYRGNFDTASPWFEKNDRIVHWSDIRNADEKNICMRWFEYLAGMGERKGTYRVFILGVAGDIKSTKGFNKEYTRYFTKAIRSALEHFFIGRKIKLKNIIHDRGQEKGGFPEDALSALGREFELLPGCKIGFMSKDHRRDQGANLIQLCDCVLGAAVTGIHGAGSGRKAGYRKGLAGMFHKIHNDYVVLSIQ